MTSSFNATLDDIGSVSWPGDHPFYVLSFVAALPAAVAIAVVAISRLLKLGDSLGSASLAGLGSVILGLMPVLDDTPWPDHCLRLDFRSPSSSFPVTVAMAMWSLVGVAVSIQFLKFKRLPRIGREAHDQHPPQANALARTAGAYSVLLAICTVFVAWSQLHSCDTDGAEALSKGIGGVSVVADSSRLLTDLLLQRTILTRARLVSPSHVPKSLGAVLGFEMFVALLFAATLFVLVWSPGGDGARWLFEHVGFVQAWAVVMTALFLLLYLTFACVAAGVMRRALVSIRAADPGSAVQGQRGALEESVSIARANIVLLILSAATTCGLYASTVWGLLTWEAGEAAWPAFLACWSAHVLFNVACALFVGFGPTREALEAVGAAASEAELAGVPLRAQLLRVV